MKKKLNILVACEESQTSCIICRNFGMNAFSCDLQECSGGHPEWHILGDCLSLINGNCDFITEDGSYHYIPKWDLIIAHPPCTYLTKAGAHLMFPKGVLNKDRLKLCREAVSFFMKFLNCDTEHVCVENPVPMHIAHLPRPDCVVDPFLFGSNFSKRTYLWMKNLPPIMYTCIQPVHRSFVFSTNGSKCRSKSDYIMFYNICKQLIDYIYFIHPDYV